MTAEPSFTIGIEEEYLLVDRVTRDLAADPPPELMEACQARLPDQVSPEFLRAQIEVGTRICDGIGAAREDLARLRACIAEEAAHHGLAPIAASTHPFARWGAQQRSRRERYDMLAGELQAVVRRLVICGMHVHVGIEDDDLRIDLMGQAAYFLPHLLALTGSSPFWQGEDTGLASYRIAVWNELPRTGLPEYFESFGEYRRYVDLLVAAGVIEDATKIWWDLRASWKFPTLEMRICDICTRLEDAVRVAALYVCLLRMLYRLRRGNQRWRRYARTLIGENRWRAQRYGVEGRLIDFGRGEAVPYAELVEELIELVAEDADALDCRREIESLREIVRAGTSAVQQRAVFEQAIAEGLGPPAAAARVVDWLIRETVEGL